MKNTLVIFAIILLIFLFFGFNIIVFISSLFNFTPMHYKSPSDLPTDSVCMNVNIKKYTSNLRDSLGRFVVSVSFTDNDYSHLVLKGRENVSIKFLNEDSTITIPAIKNRTRGVGEPKIYYYSYSPIWKKPIQKVEVYYTNKKRKTFTSYITYPKSIGLISPKNNDTTSIIQDTLLITWKGGLCPKIIILEGAHLRNMTFNKKEGTIHCKEHKMVILPNSIVPNSQPNELTAHLKFLKGQIWARWEIEGVTDPRLSPKSLFYDTFTDSTIINLY